MGKEMEGDLNILNAILNYQGVKAERVPKNHYYEIQDSNGNFIIRFYSDGQVQFSEKFKKVIKPLIIDAIQEVILQLSTMKKVEIDEDFANIGSPIGYKGFDIVAERGVLFEFSDSSSVMISLNGQILDEGELIEGQIQNGDYIWEDINFLGKQYKNLVLKEAIIQDDELMAIGNFKISIF
jgi:hypothetical protein